MNTLVIVESPSKAATIKGFLGKGYKVTASKGHVRDLPKSKLGIDLEHDFAPQYINIRGKGDLIAQLRKEAKSADRVLLATDPDREGEAISWHLATVLGLDPQRTGRISFNEITKKSLKEAVKNPKPIDMNLVDAQQARRILDRLVGYQISPFLWRKIKSGLSAGRVQSVTTRMIVEREQEIQQFVAEEYWTITVILQKDDGRTFEAKFYGNRDGKVELHNEQQAMAVVEAAKNGVFAVSDIRNAVRMRKPQPPFITSTLQQEANRRLSFQSSRTMLVAQELYEGVSTGDRSSHGLITYMRTDSLRISDEARDAAKEYICSKYGEEYYPKTPNVYRSRKNAQDAHEAIRPSDPSLTPDMIKGKVTADQYKLYKLIWERFMASQMASAVIDTVAADINCGEHVFRANGQSIRFRGYLALYDDSDDDDKDSRLPELVTGEVLTLSKLDPEQKFTQPPQRFTEGSLIKMLEEKGIGRPSTYTPTITTVISRGYVKREGKSLVPTELGFVTTDLMKDAFANIVDYDFTAKMEEDLDRIESGAVDYVTVLKDFYGDFSKELADAETRLGGTRIELPKVETGIICEKCGAMMIERVGRYGKFAACPNFPKCRNTKKLDSNGAVAEPAAKEEVVSDEKCPKCGGDLVMRNGSSGPFFACRNYPTCKYTVSIRRESGTACPICGKKVLIRQTKTKRTYYSCEDYPTCTFREWNLPTGDICPKCGGYMLKKKVGGAVYCKNCDKSEGQTK